MFAIIPQPAGAPNAKIAPALQKAASSIFSVLSFLVRRCHSRHILHRLLQSLCGIFLGTIRSGPSQATPANDNPRDDSRDAEIGTGSPGFPTKSSCGSNQPLADPHATLTDVPHRDFPNPNFSNLNLDTAATFEDPDATMVDVGPTARASAPVTVRVQPPAGRRRCDRKRVPLCCELATCGEAATRFCARGRGIE
jgi:hypothetical protein